MNSYSDSTITMFSEDSPIIEDLLSCIYTLDAEENEEVLYLILFFVYLARAAPKDLIFTLVKTIGDSLSRTKNCSKYATLFYCLVFAPLKATPDLDEFKQNYIQMSSDSALMDLCLKIS